MLENFRQRGWDCDIKDSFRVYQGAFHRHNIGYRDMSVCCSCCRDSEVAVLGIGYYSMCVMFCRMSTSLSVGSRNTTVWRLTFLETYNCRFLLTLVDLKIFHFHFVCVLRSNVWACPVIQNTPKLKENLKQVSTWCSWERLVSPISLKKLLLRGYVWVGICNAHVPMCA